MYECEWYSLKKANPAINKYLEENVFLPLESELHLSEGEIIHGIRFGLIFGVVECDISVPSDMYDHFAEFPPIFKNTNVSPADAGPLMQKFVEDNNLSTKPRRMLIGSMWGEKILLATPLLRWYVKHGLKITKLPSK